MTDLAAYAPIAARVADLAEDEELLIAATAFADPLPAVQPFREMILDTAFRRFIGAPGPGEDRPFELLDQTQGFELYIEAEPLRRLGLWLLHLLFSGRDWAGLDLSHPVSRAKWLYVEIIETGPADSFLSVAEPPRFTSYEHWPQEVRRHAFAEAAMAGAVRVAPEDRPRFAFGWSDPDWNAAWSPRTADQIIWQLTPRGLCALASLFFDMGHPILGLTEVDMEPPIVGFAATHPRSIEARFWLPGSMGFYADSLDGIRLPPWPPDPVHPA